MREKKEPTCLLELLEFFQLGSKKFLFRHGDGGFFGKR